MTTPDRPESIEGLQRQMVTLQDLGHWTEAQRVAERIEALSASTRDPIRFFESATVYATNPTVYYVPFIDFAQGRVGYAVRTNPPDNDQRETFIYFNPSSDDDGGEANVFVYIGGDNDPNTGDDTPQHYYALNEYLGIER